MENCKFCGKRLGDIDCIGDVHTRCLTVHDNRFINRVCTRCGKNPKTHDMYYCDECDAGSLYVDYPGPA